MLRHELGSASGIAFVATEGGRQRFSVFRIGHGPRRGSGFEMKPVFYVVDWLERELAYGQRSWLTSVGTCILALPMLAIRLLKCSAMHSPPFRAGMHITSSI